MGKTEARNTRERYFELIREFPLRPIRNKKDLAAAQKTIDHVLRTCRLEDDGEVDYLDVLSDLVANYEDEHCPIEPASDAEMLKMLIHDRGLTQARLSIEAKVSASTICEILSGKRPFSKAVAGKLAAYFQIDKAILLANS